MQSKWWSNRFGVSGVHSTIKPSSLLMQLGTGCCLAYPSCLRVNLKKNYDLEKTWVHHQLC